eukprot:TRINITY_DN12756_c0_g1_i1.p1 TRINITY_DN12756_c0_g1~~TRINITY_DN12756_c0_g1_i1.p1  ORF type:complete len:265 (+),score=47.95 TRINITY_DN12756_c0_g1_i1:270-1064(+)
MRLRHKVKYMAQISPLSAFCKRFHRAVNYSWREFFWIHKKSYRLQGVISGDELQAELSWARGRPESLHNKKDQQERSSGSNFLGALTQHEFNNWGSYVAAFPGMAGQLNQHAFKHSQKSHDLYLHTLIRNMGLIFCDSIPELTASEALVCQGFPVHPEFSSRSSVLCSFNVKRVGRTCAAVRHQVGNAMFIPKILVAHLHGLLSWKPHKLPDLMSNLALANRMKKKAEQQSRQQQQKQQGGKRRRLIVKQAPPHNLPRVNTKSQ